VEVAKVLFVLELNVNFLSVSALEDEGCGVVFHHGQLFIYPEGATPDTSTVLGVRYERLYRLLGQPVIVSNGFLDSESVFVSLTDGCEASSSTVKRLSWYEMTLMEEENRYPGQSSTTEVAGSSISEGAGSSSSEGATTEAEDMIDHGGGATRSTFLAKREC
jgi:hypothetical protein